MIQLKDININIPQNKAEAKLSSQERFWQSRMQSVLTRHDTEMSAIREEVEAMRRSAEEAKRQVERQLTMAKQVRWF